MQEYSYKGFKIMFEISHPENEHYQANARCFSKEDENPLPQRFQTISDSKIKVEDEIKRLVENYIDFEWKEFLKMKGEPHKESSWNSGSH